MTESLKEVEFRGSHSNWLKSEATKAWVPTPCSDSTVMPVSPASEPRGRPWGQLAPNADLPRPPRARRPGPQRVCSHRCLASQARPGPAADAETCCLRAAAGLDGKPGTPMVCYGRHIGRTSQNRVGTALRTWPLHGLYRQVLAPVRSIPRDGN